jgi:hypothetical protein
MREADNRRFNELIQTIKNNHIKRKQKNQMEYDEEFIKEVEEETKLNEVFEKDKLTYEKQQ